MPIKQAGGCDKAHFVLGTVVGQGLVFSGQIGHGVDGVNRKKIEECQGLLASSPRIYVDVTSIITRSLGQVKIP
jgi:hypothetical protein